MTPPSWHLRAHVMTTEKAALAAEKHVVGAKKATKAATDLMGSRCKRVHVRDIIKGC